MKAPVGGGGGATSLCHLCCSVLHDTMQCMQDVYYAKCPHKIGENSHFTEVSHNFHGWKMTNSHFAVVDTICMDSKWQSLHLHFHPTAQELNLDFILQNWFREKLFAKLKVYWRLKLQCHEKSISTRWCLGQTSCQGKPVPHVCSFSFSFLVSIKLQGFV